MKLKKTKDILKKTKDILEHIARLNEKFDVLFYRVNKLEDEIKKERIKNCEVDLHEFEVYKVDRAKLYNEGIILYGWVNNTSQPPYILVDIS